MFDFLLPHHRTGVIRFIPFFALFLSASAIGFAQGATCSTAEDLEGTVELQWIAPATGTAFYQWTPPFAGDFQFRFSGSDANAFFCRIKPGLGCAASGGETFVGLGSAGGFDAIGTFTVSNPNDTFLVELEDTPGGAGSLTITAKCPFSPDDAFEENDTCATAAPVGDGLYSGLFTAAQDRDLYRIRVGPGETLAIGFENGVNMHLCWALLYLPTDPVACAGSASSGTLAGSIGGDSILWTNTGPTLETVLLETRAILNLAQFNCFQYDLTISGSVPPEFSIVDFCDPMDPHSGGQSAQLVGSFGSGTGSGLHLDALQGPPNQFGYFLVGTGFSEPGIPIGLGRLCLAAAPGEIIGRYNFGSNQMQSLGIFDSNGTLQNLGNSSQDGSGFDVPPMLPNIGTTIQSGQTWYFQVWFRDSGAGSGQTGFTQGIAATF